MKNNIISALCFLVRSIAKFRKRKQFIHIKELSQQTKNNALNMYVQLYTVEKSGKFQFELPFGFKPSLPKHE